MAEPTPNAPREQGEKPKQAPAQTPEEARREEQKADVREKYANDHLEGGNFDPYKAGLVPNKGAEYQENGITVYWNCANKGDSVEKVMKEYKDAKGNPPLDAKKVDDPRWQGVVVKWKKITE